MKFNPALAGYLAITAGASFGVYLLYQKFFGAGGAWDKAGAIMDAAAEQSGFDAATTAYAPQLKYDQARSDWFKAHGLSGSEAMQRAQQTDFPSETNWLAGQPFPA